MINIYGDSYADPDWKDQTIHWQGLVRQFEDINVISSGGESTYNLLRELQANLPKENDKIIFLLTERT